MRRVTVRGEASKDKIRFPAGDEIENSGTGDGSSDLSYEVRKEFVGREAFADNESDRDCRVEVAARDVPDSVCHREHRKSEGKGNADETDAKLRECSGKNSGAASSEDEPKGTKELCSRTF